MSDIAKIKSVAWFSTGDSFQLETDSFAPFLDLKHTPAHPQSCQIARVTDHGFERYAIFSLSNPPFALIRNVRNQNTHSPRTVAGNRVHHESELAINKFYSAAKTP